MQWPVYLPQPKSRNYETFVGVFGPMSQMVQVYVFPGDQAASLTRGQCSSSCFSMHVQRHMVRIAGGALYYGWRPQIM